MSYAARVIISIIGQIMFCGFIVNNNEEINLAPPTMHACVTIIVRTNIKYFYWIPCIAQLKR